MSFFPDGTSFSPVLYTDMKQVYVFLTMMLVFLLGIRFVQWRQRYRSPVVHIPWTRAEREMHGATGVQFYDSNSYQKYRNPMREFRRFLQWPSGRQWVKLKKQYNRMMPDGAKKFANMAANVRYNARNPKEETL